MVWDTQIAVKAFMKAETAAGWPRNISTVPDTHAIELSRYTYAFKKDVLVNTNWYAPGHALESIARRIVEICQTFDTVVETDYSKFDGTISVWLREHVERAVYMRYFNGFDRQTVGELINKEISAYGKTRSGQPYDPAGSRLSGSPLTTDGNTLINAFAAYCALRVAGCEARDAYRNAGIFGGDDGVSPAQAHLLEKVAVDLGLRLKCGIRRHGEGHVSFLNRRFEDPWVGQLGSVGSPLRAMTKIHHSFAPLAKPLYQRMFDRAEGYQTLDPVSSPLVFAVCRAMKRVAISLAPADKRRSLVGQPGMYDMPYYVWAYRHSTGTYGTWPQASTDFGLRLTAEEFGVTTGTVLDWIDRIDDIETQGDFVVHAGFITNPPPERPIPVVIQGDAWSTLPPWAKRVIPTKTESIRAQINHGALQRRGARRAANYRERTAATRPQTTPSHTPPSQQRERP
jgi:hypothetical protein